MLISPYDLRAKRAKAIPSEDIRFTWYVPEEGWVEAEGWVKSQSGKYGYRVEITLIQRAVHAARCSCPDYNKKMQGKGIPTYKGVRRCKHIEAIAREVRLASGWHWEIEFAGGGWVHYPTA